jgi:hypothetical protein
MDDTHPKIFMDFLKENTYTKATLPTSWKCEPLNMTMKEVDEIETKTFVPYGGTSFDTYKITDNSIIKKI